MQTTVYIIPYLGKTLDPTTMLKDNLKNLKSPQSTTHSFYGLSSSSKNHTHAVNNSDQKSLVPLHNTSHSHSHMYTHTEREEDQLSERK